MKKVFSDSLVAKFLLCLSSCHTITIGPFVLSKLRNVQISQRVRNHECTHARQWIEMTVVTGLLIWVSMLVWGISVWWLGLAVLAFYFWYVLEYVIRFFIYKKPSKAYEKVSFEQEAYKNETDSNYLENSHYFAWLHYIFRV